MWDHRWRIEDRLLVVEVIDFAPDGEAHVIHTIKLHLPAIVDEYNATNKLRLYEE